MSHEYVPNIPHSIPLTSDKTILAVKEEIRENVIEFIAGAVGGTASLVVGHPFDTVKTVTQNSVSKMALTDGICGLGQHGYRTFFRGMSIPMWSYSVVSACTFMSYKFSLRFMNPEVSSISSYSQAGAFAGLIQLFPGTPVDVIKIQMQRDAIKWGPLRQQGPMTYISLIINQDGLRGLYKGLGIHAFRDIPSFALYFPCYEFCNNIASKNDWYNPRVRALVCGAVAGALSWAFVIPLDIMKTRIQAGIDKDMKESFKVLRRSGVGSFFRGGTMIMLRAIVASAVTFMVYEECSKDLRKKM